MPAGKNRSLAARAVRGFWPVALVAVSSVLFGEPAHTAGATGEPAAEQDNASRGLPEALVALTQLDHVPPLAELERLLGVRLVARKALGTPEAGEVIGNVGLKHGGVQGRVMLMYRAEDANHPMASAYMEDLECTNPRSLLERLSQFRVAPFVRTHENPFSPNPDAPVRQAFRGRSTPGVLWQIELAVAAHAPCILSAQVHLGE